MTEQTGSLSFEEDIPTYEDDPPDPEEKIPPPPEPDEGNETN